MEHVEPDHDAVGRLRRKVASTLSWLRRVPTPVLWLCGLHLFMLVGFSILTPTWRAPDEPNHADLIIGVRESWSYPRYDGRDVDPGVRGSFSLVHLERRSRNLLRQEALPRDERPSRVDLRKAGEDVDLQLTGRPGIGNHIPQHPPGYYVVTAVAAQGVDLLLPGDGLGAYDREVGIIRMLSLAVAVPLPLVAWWVAQGAGAPRSAAIAAAIAPLAIPQLTHIASVVNSDATTVVLFGLITGLIVRVGRGDLALRTVAVLGALTGVAFFVKGTAFVVPAWAFVALAIGYRRLRRVEHTEDDTDETEVGTGDVAAGAAAGGWRWPLARLATFSVTAFVLGGWWWVANIVRFGTYWPSIEFSTRLSALRVRPPGFEPQPLEWFKAWAPAVVRRYWGEFGWVDFAIPAGAIRIASLVVVCGVLLLVWPSVRGSRARLDGPTVLLLGLPTILLALLFGANTYIFYRDAGYMVGVQGRYLFGGIVGLAVVVAAGWQRVAGRWAPLALLCAAVVLQGLAVRAMLHFWWGAADASLTERLRAMLAWSTWPGELVGLLAVLGALVALATVRSLVLEARRTMVAGRL